MMKNKKDILELRNLRINGLKGYETASESCKDEIVKNHLFYLIDREEFIIRDLNWILDLELDDMEIIKIGDDE